MKRTKNSEFKLIYYDKENKPLDLKIIFLNFEQSLFGIEHKFGLIDILAIGKIDRDESEVYSDKEDKPLLTLKLYEDLSYAKINGDFILPLYIRSFKYYGVIDGENAIYHFSCLPYSFSILMSNVVPFSLNIKPKKNGKLPNIKDIIRAVVSKQPALTVSNYALIMPSDIRTFDILYTRNSTRPVGEVNTAEEELEEELEKEEYEEEYEEKYEEEEEYEEEGSESENPVKKLKKRKRKKANKDIEEEFESENLVEEGEIEDEEIPEEIEPELNNVEEETEKIIEDLQDLEENNRSIKEEIRYQPAPSDPEKDSDLEVEDYDNKPVKVKRRKSRLERLRESLKEQQESAIKRFKKQKENFEKRLKKLEDKHRNNVNSLNSKIDVFRNYLRNVCSRSLAFLRKIIDFISTITSFINKLTGYFNYIASLISRLRNAIENYLLNVIHTILSAIFDPLRSLLNIQGCAQDMLNAVTSISHAVANLLQTIINLPNTLRNEFERMMDTIRNEINNFATMPARLFNEFRDRLMREFESTIRTGCDSVRSIILISPCEPIGPQLNNLKNSIRNIITPIQNVLGPLFSPKKVTDNVIDKIYQNNKDLLENNPKIPEELDPEPIIREYVREELEQIKEELMNSKDESRTLLEEVFDSFREYAESVFSQLDEEAREQFPDYPDNDFPEGMDEETRTLMDQLIEAINNFSSITQNDYDEILSSLDVNTEFWNELFSFTEDYLVTVILLHLLYLQQAYTLLSYRPPETAFLLSSGVLDPTQQIRFVFGVDFNELINFDKVSKLIVKRLSKDKTYSIKSGSIYYALNQAITDLAPCPVSNFLSIVYYTDNGMSHTFLRYRLYPGQMELGYNEIDINDEEARNALFGPEFFLLLQKGMARKIGKPLETTVNIKSIFTGFPTEKVKLTSTMSGFKFEKIVSVKEEIANMIFCGKSMYSEKKSFLISPLPGSKSQIHNIPVPYKDLSYDGLFSGRFFGRISNLLTKNSIITQEVSFVGKNAYAYFLILWTGDILMFNILPLFGKNPYAYKSTHIFSPRYIITGKRFQYVNPEYRKILEEYRNRITSLSGASLDQMYRIDYVLQSNDDGMKSIKDVAGQSFAIAVEKSYSACVMDQTRNTKRKKKK